MSTSLYDEFVRKVCVLDNRNRFCNAVRTNIHLKLPAFYQYYDPVDVEFDSSMGCIKMVPIGKLESVTAQYSYVDPDVVFATSNGDPLFVKNKMVFCCTHGSKNPKLKMLANTFDAFLKSII